MDVLVETISDPLALVLIIGCGGLAAACGVLFKSLMSVTTRSIEAQTDLRRAVDGIASKLDTTAAVDARMIETLGELKAELRR